MRALALNITGIMIIRLRLQHVGGSDKVCVLFNAGDISSLSTLPYLGVRKAFSLIYITYISRLLYI